MDKKQLRNILRYGVKFVGTYGAVTIGNNLVPRGLSPCGKVACTAAVIFAGMAFSDLIEEQLLKCDAEFDKIANGNGDFIVV